MADKAPRVLFIDIETSPIIGYAWGAYEQNLLKILQQSHIICVAWKWLGDRDVTVKALPDFPGYKAGELDDYKLVKLVHDVLDEADVVIAHNGDKFDVKKLNARFVFHKLNAPSFYQTVDTLKVAKKHFRFDSNTLNNIGGYLLEGEKINTGGFDLWEDCMAGNAAAWTKMKRYNVRDIELLERVYIRLRPFMSAHPNLNVIADPAHKGISCPVCLSLDLMKRGFSQTRTGRRQRYQCNNCYSWSSGAFTKANVALH